MTVSADVDTNVVTGSQASAFLEESVLAVGEREELTDSRGLFGHACRLAVFVDVLKKKRMMAVVAVRNRVCAVLQTAVGAAVCVHSSGGVHSLRAGVAGGGSLG